MQTATDVFLGWTRGKNGKDVYVRQLRDMKMSAVIDDWDTGLLRQYSRMCAHALARAHARSGDAAMISGYMGSGQTFDDAIGEFAVEYADQNRSDYRAFIHSIREGKIKVIVES
jgi:predicted alpha/beta hydrolase